MMLKRFRKIFELEASTGILLLISTIIALLIANSQNFDIYEQFLAIKLPLSLPFNINKELTIHNWINDGLMAIFFLLIGLELKEEIIYRFEEQDKWYLHAREFTFENFKKWYK